MIRISVEVAQNGVSESANVGLIVAATDTKVRHGHSFRLGESLLLGHVSSEDLLIDSLKEEFGICLVLFFGP